MTEVIVPLAQVFVSPEDEDELGWQDQALCAQTDPEAFFPEKGGSTREAKRVCRSCEVRAECLEYALEHDERFGIWGGMSERERRRLKREARKSRRFDWSDGVRDYRSHPARASSHRFTRTTTSAPA